MAKLYGLICTCARDDLVDLFEVGVLGSSETSNEEKVCVEVVVIELTNGLAGRG